MVLKCLIFELGVSFDHDAHDFLRGVKSSKMVLQRSSCKSSMLLTNFLIGS